MCGATTSVAPFAATIRRASISSGIRSPRRWSGSRASIRISTRRRRSFHEQLRAFRERDKALNDALIAAQQLRGEVREQAEREAQLILREAQAEGERIIEAAKSDVRRMEEELDNLDRSRRTYLAQMRTLIARQLSEVEASDSQVVASTLRGAGSNSSGSNRE